MVIFVSRTDLFLWCLHKTSSHLVCACVYNYINFDINFDINIDINFDINFVHIRAYTCRHIKTCTCKLITVAINAQQTSILFLIQMCQSIHAGRAENSPTCNSKVHFLTGLLYWMWMGLHIGQLAWIQCTTNTWAWICTMLGQCCTFWCM